MDSEAGAAPCSARRRRPERCPRGSAGRVRHPVNIETASQVSHFPAASERYASLPRKQKWKYRKRELPRRRQRVPRRRSSLARPQAFENSKSSPAGLKSWQLPPSRLRREAATSGSTCFAAVFQNLQVGKINLKGSTSTTCCSAIVLSRTSKLEFL